MCLADIKVNYPGVAVGTAMIANPASDREHGGENQMSHTGGRHLKSTIQRKKCLADYKGEEDVNEVDSNFLVVRVSSSLALRAGSSLAITLAQWWRLPCRIPSQRWPYARPRCSGGES